MTTPAPPQPDPLVTVQAGLAETPFGQRVAVVITALLPKDAAQQIAAAITEITGQMSGTRLVTAVPGAPLALPANGKAGG